MELCSRCDRGNIYCFTGCAEAARHESLKRAGQVYQSTSEGRLKHAVRQQRYLERRLAKMTHQGSERTSAPAASESPQAMTAAAKEANDATDTTSGEIALAHKPFETSDNPRQCAACKHTLGPYARRHFLQWRTRHRLHERPRPPP